MSLTDTLIDAALDAGIPPLLIGQPGCGKTDRLHQAAERRGWATHTLYAWAIDPTDLAGLPIPTGPASARTLRRLLDAEYQAIFEAAAPLLLVVDELGQASASQQAALAPLLLARRVGLRELPECVRVCGATNRRTDRAGAGHLLSHLVSRCALIDVAPELDDFSAWALASPGRVHPSVLGLLRFRPALLSDFDPASSDAGSRPYACPRSWVSASRLLGARPDDGDLAALTRTVVGEAAAVELAAFHASARALPQAEKILADPSLLERDLPRATLYAVTCALAYRASAATATALCAVAERLRALGHGEFAALLLRDASRVAPAMLATSAWAALCAGPLGAELRS